MWISSFRALLLAILAMVVAATGAQAQKEKATFNTKAEFAILMDADTGSVLFEKNADELMHPASMSKLMTLALIFQALKEKKISMDDEFTVSEFAWRTGGAPSGTSAMFVPLNGSATLGDLIQGIAVQSGNDACIIVAEGMSGSEHDFADAMNAYAKKIGMKESSFANSTGLPHPDHMMTARELAVLARHLIQDYPEYYHYFGQKEFLYRDRFKFHNRNSLIYTYPGADGLKTGFIKASGYGMVVSARQRKQRLIAVVNGLKSKRERQQEARKLLDWGFRSFKQYKLFDEGETVGEALVWGGTQFFVPLTGDDGVRILLPRKADKRLKASIVYEGPLKPPIRKGDQVAVLRVTTANEATTEVPLYAAQDIESGGIVSRGFDSLFHLAFGWIL